MLSEKEASERLRKGELDVWPMQLALVEEGRGEYGNRPDFLIDLTWKESNVQRMKFVVEYKSVATPKNVEVAIDQAKRYARMSHEGRLPMILAPYISKAAEKRLIDEGVSGIDFSGNVIVIVPGEWVIIQTGHPNLFRSTRPIKSIYGGKSALVGRVLLGRPPFAGVQEVQEEVLRRGEKLSLGTVSKVLTALEEELIITKKDSIRLIQPERLLDQLVKHYKGPDIQQRLIGKVSSRGEFLGRLLEAALSGVRIVGKSEALYVLSPRSEERTCVYVSSIGDWVSNTPFQETDRFSNAEIIQVKGDEVFFDSMMHEGFPWCSKLQIYLELMRGGKREQEVAMQLRQEIITGPVE